MLSDADRAALRAAVRGELRFEEPMARRTTLRIGGPADAWLEPADAADVQRAVETAASRHIPVTPVGGGSNLLVRDGGIRGLVVATRSLRKIERVGPTRLVVEAGVSTGKLLQVATEAHLGGVEFLGGVPGSVGGGMIMNAGTYLGEFKDVTTEVVSVRIRDGARIARTNAECGFSYRHSQLPADEIVVEATLELRPRPRAEISPKHANWIVNVGEARASDVLALVDLARAAVAEKFGVTLEMEVKVIGEDS